MAEKSKRTNKKTLELKIFGEQPFILLGKIRPYFPEAEIIVDNQRKHFQCGLESFHVEKTEPDEVYYLRTKEYHLVGIKWYRSNETYKFVGLKEKREEWLELYAKRRIDSGEIKTYTSPEVVVRNTLTNEGRNFGYDIKIRKIRRDVFEVSLSWENRKRALFTINLATGNKEFEYRGR